jgi:lipid II:glycine glycyltransferase (peptidoglycan interpeptide bridge formation enzyme)
MTRAHSSDDDEWDRFLAANPFGYHEQTSQYAILREPYGFQHDRAVVRDAQGQIIGGASVIFRRTPIGRLGVVERGPVARDDDPLILAQVVKEVSALAKRQRLASIRVNTFENQANARAALAAEGYCNTRAWADEEICAVLDLHLSDEQMLADMGRSERNQVGGAMRKGVAVKVGSAEDLHGFYDLHMQNAKHYAFPVFPMAYFSYLRDLFGEARVPLFLAYHEGKPICGLICSVMGDRMYACWSGMDRAPEIARLNANRLLFFKASGWGRDQGLNGFDMTGTDYFRKNLASYNVTRPAAMRKHFGPLRGVHKRVIEASATGVLKKLAVKGAWHLGYLERIPH